MKKYRAAIAVAAVFVVLLVVVLVTQPNNNTTPSVSATPTLSADQQKLQIIKLPDNNAANRLELRQTDPAKTAVYKLDGNWKLEGQENLALDASTIGSTMSQLSTLSGNQLVQENSNNLTSFGLDKPQLVIVFSTPTFSKTLQVGITNPVTSNYYVKLADADKVWTVSNTLIDTLKGWVNNPPLEPPTPTPLPTLPPTNTPAPTPSGSPAGSPGTAGTTPTPTPASTTASAATSPPGATPSP